MNQSIWMEGEAQFADIILPACTSLERWDIGEWSNSGGYAHHGVGCVNRVLTLQHKCIEPLGESRSDYDIFTASSAGSAWGGVHRRLRRTGLGQARLRFIGPAGPHLLARLLPQGILRRAARAARTAPTRRYALVRGRPPQGVPEPHPLPSQFAESSAGVQTPSGKLEFVPELLKRHNADNPERPP